MSFNEAQKQAIMHVDGPCMVLAGPGSGKTTVITNRVKYLIESAKISPGEILVITFSKAAANEMKERFHKLTDYRHAGITFGTFHGVYYGILKWAYKLNANNILSEQEKYVLLKQITERLNLDIEDEKDFLQGISEEIGRIKNEQIFLDTYHSQNCSEDVFKQIFQAYETERRRLRKLDFDDMLVLTLELFQKRPDVLSLWQEKFRYILIDEFQDINKVQYEVIRMLALPEKNLFIVGDDDQSIYRFRGSKPEIMLGFEKDYENAKRILLDTNYRSTKSIVRAAAKVIKNNENRFQKNSKTINEEGLSVHIQELQNPIEESKYVIRQIQHAKRQGVDFGDIAVLFRTSVEARVLAESMMEYNIPFYMKEHIPNLYDHFIARNLMTYMKMALGDRTRASFLEIMNRPNRYISRNYVDNKEISFADLNRAYQDKEWMLERIMQFEIDLKVIGRCAPYGAIQYIRKHIGYDEFLEEYALKRRIRLEDLQDVLHAIEERAKEYKTIEEWFSYIEEYSEEIKKQGERYRQNEDVVSLMTMHSSKGLEFHTVFLIGSNEDIIPYKKAVLKEDLEEERRMFYVGMTRAKKRLIISYNRERNGKKMSPSRFVLELLDKNQGNCK